MTYPYTFPYALGGGLGDPSVQEQALLAWVAAATGLGRVLLREAKKPQPNPPYATVFLPVAHPFGGGPDEVRTQTDLTQPAGQEIQLVTVGHREVTVEVAIYTRATVGGTDPLGFPSARTFLQRLQLAVTAPLKRQLLTVAGLVPIDVVHAEDLTERLGPVGQGRATLSLLCRFVDVDVGQVGYIATADVTGTVG